VTQQYLVRPPQDHGNDVVILHRSSMTLAGKGCRTRDTAARSGGRRTPTLHATRSAPRVRRPGPCTPGSGGDDD
jgi:hypothetical protein